MKIITSSIMKSKTFLNVLISVIFCVIMFAGCTSSEDNTANLQVDCPINELSWGMSESEVLSALSLKDNEYKTDISESETEAASEVTIYDAVKNPKVYKTNPTSMSYKINKQMGLYEINFSFDKKDSEKFINTLTEIYGEQEQNTYARLQGENAYKWISELDTRSIDSKIDDKIQKFMNEIYVKSDMDTREQIIKTYKQSPMVTVYMSTHPEKEDMDLVKIDGNKKALEKHFSQN